MTQNNTAAPLDLLEWIQAHQEEMISQDGWHPHLSDSHGAETLLRNKAPFTYVLRAADKILTYFISFVKADGSIKHQFFVLEPTQQGWRYRNGCTENSPTEIVANSLKELIPMMMHCEQEEGRPLKAFCK